MANVSHLCHKHTDLVQFKKALGQIWPRVQNIILCVCVFAIGIKAVIWLLGQHDAILAVNLWKLSDSTLHVQFFNDLCSCVYPRF